MQPQLVTPERFKEFVDVLGIEEAYRNRYRGTGRTVRNVLDLVKGLSLGKKVYIMTYQQNGKHRDHALDVVRTVMGVSELLGMRHGFTVSRRDKLEYEPSGGVLVVISGNKAGLRLDDYEEYHLHDC